MKILFLNPSGVIGTQNQFANIFEKGNGSLPNRYLFSGPSIGLLIIASLTPNKHNITYIDEDLEKIDFDEKYNIVAMSVTTQKAIRAYEIADKYRARGIMVVMGGIHPTLMPEEAGKYADVVFVGEGENMWGDFLDDYKKGDVKKIYKSKGPFDMSKSILPRYDLLSKYKYKIIWIQTTRGCPYDCEFCAASKIYGLKFRHKTIKQVLDEMKYIKKHIKNPIIGFADDNMFVNRAYSEKLLKGIEKIRVRWVAQSDISIGENRKLLNLIRSSGGFVLYIGFESIKKDNLEGLDKLNWKLRKAATYSKSIESIQKNGIGIIGSFIIGFDDDTKQDFENLKRFIVDSNLYGSAVNILTPLPGTRLRKKLDDEGRVLNSLWSNYDYWHTNFMPKNFKPQELEECLNDIYRYVYNSDNRAKVSRHFKIIYHKLDASNAKK